MDIVLKNEVSLNETTIHLKTRLHFCPIKIRTKLILIDDV